MTSFLQTSGVQYNSFACSTTHTQLTDSRSGYFPVARYGDYLVCERVKWDVEMGWSRRNWTGNFKIAKFKELMWQISLNRGGWVMGRKNWMSLRVSFRLTQTRWSSRQNEKMGNALVRGRHLQAGKPSEMAPLLSCHSWEPPWRHWRRGCDLHQRASVCRRARGAVWLVLRGAGL